MKISGFTEIVISVSDLRRTAGVWIAVLGYEYRTPPTPLAQPFFDYWKLPKHLTGEFCLLANPLDTTGCLCLVQLNKVPEQIQMRSSCAIWDTGGIFDFNVRVKDVEATFRALQRQGWQGFTDPKAFDFGKFRVKEVVMKSFDGEILALIERISPPLEGFPNLQTSSYIFNSTQIVQNIEQSYQFYCTILGFKEYLHHRSAATNDGTNVIGLPKSLAQTIVRNVYILHPEAVNDGSIELMEIEGLAGENRSKYCRLPNLGILTLRFPVSDLLAFKDYLKSCKIEILFEGSWSNNVQELTINTPDGALLSFYQEI
jgi:catechol 2,3-dioxygenase-like lactoylglutathione lyase family enzyme